MRVPSIRQLLGLGVYTNIEYLSRMLGEEFVITGAQLKLKHPRGLQGVCREVKRLPSMQAVNSRGRPENITEKVIKMQERVISLIVLFAGMIFFSSLLNTTLISFAERKREIATLSVLGYKPWQIGGYFLRRA